MSFQQDPWQRQRDGDGNLESNLWYDRFTAYRLMGPTRSLLSCVNAERVKHGHEESNYTPGSWRNAQKKWRWNERAEDWDEYERQREETEREEERKKEHQRREWMLAGWRGKIATALEKFNPELRDDVTMAQLTQAIRMYLEQSRAEYDDLPTQKQEISGAGGGPVQITSIEVIKPNDN